MRESREKERSKELGERERERERDQLHISYLIFSSHEMHACMHACMAEPI